MSNQPEYVTSADTPLPEGRILAALGAFIGMSLLCEFIIVVVGYTTFKRRSGLYFLSICGAVFGSFLFTMATITYYFVLGYSYLGISAGIWTAGVLLYIPSQYLVLYSRLHLLQTGPKTLMFVRILCACQFILVEIPICVLSIGTLNTTSDSEFAKIDRYWQMVEVPIYTAVSTVLSGIYIYQAYKFFHAGADPKTKSILMHLMVASAFLILLGGFNIAAQFAGLESIQICWLSFLYSFDLLVEFWILNQLTGLATRKLDSTHQAFNSLPSSGIETLDKSDETTFASSYK